LETDAANGEDLGMKNGLDGKGSREKEGRGKD
jgi:hypothetical protein